MARKSTETVRTADWYATAQGRRETEREFTRALRGGTLVRSQGGSATKTDRAVLEELIAQAKARATKPVSLRIPIADIERGKAIAAKKGLGYQTVLKQAIHEGLKRAS